MPSLDIADHPLVAALQDAFGALIEDRAVDIVPQDDADGAEICEVQADAWTLVLEGWPLEKAWIAIDDAPAPQQARAALEATLDRRDLVAMIVLDNALTGDVTTALRESGDDLSIALATMIAAGT